MERYSEYIESDVEWIGEIPSEWSLQRINNVFNERTEKVSDLDYEPLSVTKNGIFPQLENVAKSDNHDNRKLVRNGDFVINSRSDRRGSSGMSSLDGSVSLINIVISPKPEIKVRYAELLFKSYEFINEYYRNGRGIVADLWSTRYELMKNISICLPPLKEQEQIVAFLDDKTEKIDDLLAKTKSKISLLKEKRTVLINHCVTKGLNSNATMKDSGIEWIGEIPSGWNESQFKYFIKLRHGHQFRDTDFTDSGIKIVKITQLDKKGYLNISNCSTIDANRLDDFNDIIINEGDILMCLTGGTIGKIIKVGNVSEPLLQNYRVGHFSTVNEDEMSNYFMFYLMSSEVIVGQIFFDVRETGQPNIGMEDMNRMRICIPPLKEQQQIVDYLDEQTSKIDTTISKEEKRIALLKEYRQSLISNVVTGKIKVCN